MCIVITFILADIMTWAEHFFVHLPWPALSISPRLFVWPLQDMRGLHIIMQSSGQHLSLLASTAADTSTVTNSLRFDDSFHTVRNIALIFNDHIFIIKILSNELWLLKEFEIDIVSYFFVYKHKLSMMSRLLASSRVLSPHTTHFIMFQENVTLFFIQNIFYFYDHLYYCVLIRSRFLVFYGFILWISKHCDVRVREWYKNLRMIRPRLEVRRTEGSQLKDRTIRNSDRSQSNRYRFDIPEHRNSH